MRQITPHQAIRKHLARSIRPDPRSTLNEDPSKGDRPSLDSLRNTEWIPQFEQYMRNRLIMGACRYETFQEKMKGNNYECLRYIRDKCDEYEKTHNLECLVDLANVAMIEFGAPHFPDAHFTPGDDTSHVGTFKKE
jgi:hypothetical protein